MATTNIISGIEKTVKYNRLNKDFDCYVIIDGGEPLHIGYAQTAHEGEEKCDQYVYFISSPLGSSTVTLGLFIL